MDIKEHLDLLGLKVKDSVTGFDGVVSTISFDLYGCIQAVVTPPMTDVGELKDGRWFDITRLIVIDNNPVMITPDFNSGYVTTGRKGSDCNKPIPQ